MCPPQKYRPPIVVFSLEPQTVDPSQNMKSAHLIENVLPPFHWSVQNGLLLKRPHINQKAITRSTAKQNNIFVDVIPNEDVSINRIESL
jgi:hypothetical protein